jgi:hypothetical protein
MYFASLPHTNTSATLLLDTPRVESLYVRSVPLIPYVKLHLGRSTWLNDASDRTSTVESQPSPGVAEPQSVTAKSSHLRSLVPHTCTAYNHIRYFVNYSLGLSLAVARLTERVHLDHGTSPSPLRVLVHRPNYPRHIVLHSSDWPKTRQGQIGHASRFGRYRPLATYDVPCEIPSFARIHDEACGLHRYTSHCCVGGQPVSQAKRDCQPSTTVYALTVDIPSTYQDHMAGAERAEDCCLGRGRAFRSADCPKSPVHPDIGTGKGYCLVYGNQDHYRLA